MTIWAQRAERGDGIDIKVSYGPVSVTVTEPRDQLRTLWGRLGELLEFEQPPPPGTVPLIEPGFDPGPVPSG